MIEFLTILSLMFGFNPPEISAAGMSCLQRNVYFEARNQSLEGKLAVASVTLNRKRSESFPDRVCDVVEQKRGKVCQFSWVCSTHALRLSNRLEQIAWIESWVAAAYVATAGPWLEDALYFHTTAVDPYWNKRVPLLVVIDDHIFYGS